MEMRGDINSTVHLGKDIQEIKNTIAETNAVFDLSQDRRLPGGAFPEDDELPLARVLIGRDLVESGALFTA